MWLQLSLVEWFKKSPKGTKFLWNRVKINIFGGFFESLQYCWCVDASPWASRRVAQNVSANHYRNSVIIMISTFSALPTVGASVSYLLELIRFETVSKWNSFELKLFQIETVSFLRAVSPQGAIQIALTVQQTLQLASNAACQLLGLLYETRRSEWLLERNLRAVWNESARSFKKQCQ